MKKSFEQLPVLFKIGPKKQTNKELEDKKNTITAAYFLYLRVFMLHQWCQSCRGPLPPPTHCHSTTQGSARRRWPLSSAEPGQTALVSFCLRSPPTPSGDRLHTAKVVYPCKHADVGMISKLIIICTGPFMALAVRAAPKDRTKNMRPETNKTGA